MSGRVHDRVIVVTGAAGGQGAAEAIVLRDEGAIVVATNIQSFAGEEPTASTAAVSTSRRSRSGRRWTFTLAAELDSVFLTARAAAAVFLASDEPGYITGENLVVDGRWSSVLPGQPPTLRESEDG